MASLQAPGWALMIVLLVVTGQPATCENSETFHIIPSASSPCPERLTGEPSLTLFQYISGEYRKYTSDPSEIILEFQPGRHTLSIVPTRYSIFASQLFSFTMNSKNSTEIDCDDRRDQHLITNVQNVHISGIDFVRCSLRIESVLNFTLEESSFSQVQRYISYDVLYIQNSSATIKRCSFTNNNRLPLHIDNSSMELHHTTFINNRGDYRYNSNNWRSGGALFIENTQSIVTISHCSFVDNSAYYSGGAIFTSSSLFIQQSSFMNNRVSSGSGFHGGAIYAAGVYISLSINQSEFTNNRLNRAGNGGAIYVNGNSVVYIYQSLMKGNSVQSGSGGAVFLTGTGSHTILITESTINKNSGARCGALSITDGQLHNVNLEHSILIDNSAITSSGGVACIRSATVSILNSTFSQNRAAENGGAFRIDNSEMIIQGSIFDNNTAGANGGVLNSEYFRISLFISHTSFTNNQATEQGGVMYLGRKGSKVNIMKSIIDFNDATRGGFATVLGSSLEIATSNIFNNTAETGEVISACYSDTAVSDQLITATDPVYSVCTLFSGSINETDLKVTTTNTTEALVDATTTADIPTTTSKPTPETTTVTMRATTSLPTKPNVTSSVYFELNGKVYPNNSVISLSEVGENGNALLCKTDLVICCATLPNRFGEYYYPSGDTVSVKKAGHGFYRNRGVQEVRLNRREGVNSPSGMFRCAIPDASGTVQNLYIHLLSEETMQDYYDYE